MTLIAQPALPREFSTELDTVRLQLEYLEQVSPGTGRAEYGLSSWAAPAVDAFDDTVIKRLLNSLSSLAGRERLKPRQDLELS